MDDGAAAGVPMPWQGCRQAQRLLKSLNSIANASASNPVTAR